MINLHTDVGGAENETPPPGGGRNINSSSVAFQLQAKNYDYT